MGSSLKPKAWRLWAGGKGLGARIEQYTRRAGVIEAVVAHAKAAAPAECCGLLLGRDNEIVEALPARNLSDDPNRFLIDPQDHFDALRLARQRGLDLLGFYHSHPQSPPQPSATDIAEWSYPEAVCLIVSLESETPEVRLFRSQNSNFVEAPFGMATVDSRHLPT